jgi:hypothetical protein
MLQLRTTRIFKSLFENLATGVAIQEEGVALAFVKEAGETKVQLSTGAAGEVFAGFAIARNMPPATIPMVEEGVVEASASGSFTRAPLAGQVMVKVGGAPMTVITDPLATPAADEILIVGASYQVAPANAGKAIFAQYLYQPTVAEARTVIGDAPYGGLSANALGTVGCLKQAEVGTSFFDASADWSNALFAKLAAGGRLAPSTGPADAAIPGLTVKSSPTAGSPFLVVEINVG